MFFEREKSMNKIPAKRMEVINRLWDDTYFTLAFDGTTLHIANNNKSYNYLTGEEVETEQPEDKVNQLNKKNMERVTHILSEINYEYGKES